jgi:hypothetical protein
MCGIVGYIGEAAAVCMTVACTPFKTITSTTETLYKKVTA